MRADSTPEGTIRFGYALRPGTASDAIPSTLFATIEGWRRVLRSAALVGRDAARYGGLAFGNLSVRDPACHGRFFITASQCVGEDALDASAIVRIDHCDSRAFSVRATGTRAPSSETLTHAAVYAADASTRWLFHVHSPAIWQHARALRLPATGADTPYGTSALATEVAALLAGTHARPFVFVTPGHEDGVFACGRDADSVGCALVALLARAHAEALA
jgi:hypothetical protein